MTRRSAYSILELLIACGILSVVMAAAIGGWMQVTRGSRKGEASVNAMRDLHTIFAHLRDDLGSIIIDRPISGAGAGIDVCSRRVSGVGGITQEIRFFKVYSQVPQTLQPVAGQIAYRLVGGAPPYTLRREIFDVSTGGVSSSPREYKDHGNKVVQSFKVRYFRRDAPSGALVEIPDDVLSFDSPNLPDCMSVQLEHRDASRITGYVSIASRLVRGASRLQGLHYLNDWLVPQPSVVAPGGVPVVVYQPGNALNIGGTGVVLSSVNLR